MSKDNREDWRLVLLALNISINNGNIFLSDGNTMRYVRPGMFVDAISNALDKRTYDFGLLPPGTRQIKVNSDSAIYVIEFPASVQPVMVKVPGIRIVVFTIPLALPPLLFFVSIKSNPVSLSALRAFAFQCPLSLNSMLYFPPLPNIYTDSPHRGLVCLGSIDACPRSDYNNVATWAVSNFFSSMFNSDLSDNLYLYLKKLVSFICDNECVDLINPNTPVGKCLLDSYLEGGIPAMLTSLFSPDTLRVFCATYADSIHHGDCTQYFPHLASAMATVSTIASDKLIDYILSDNTLLLQQCYLIPIYMLMSAFTTYPVSALKPVETYCSYIANLSV